MTILALAIFPRIPLCSYCIDLFLFTCIYSSRCSVFFFLTSFCCFVLFLLLTCVFSSSSYLSSSIFITRSLREGFNLIFAFNLILLTGLVRGFMVSYTIACATCFPFSFYTNFDDFSSSFEPSSLLKSIGTLLFIDGGDISP